jgi:hypothetical protein
MWCLVDVCCGCGQLPKPYAAKPQAARGWPRVLSACIDRIPELDLERLSFRHREARGGSSGDYAQSGVSGCRASSSMRRLYVCDDSRDGVTMVLALIRCHPTGARLR